MEHAGLSDDCHELTILRRFRDDYVLRTPGGATLVSNYYATAPSIVSAIQQSPNRSGILSSLLVEIRAIVAQIESGASAVAIASYRAMFERLQRDFSK